MTVHPFIEAEKVSGHSVKRACELPQVSRTAFYARRSGQLGPRRRRIARLMRTAGLQGRHRRRRHLTTIPDPRAAARPDLIVRNFAPDPDSLDSRWCGDITYIPTEEGWLYPATVIDIASRRVVAGLPSATCGPNWSPTPSDPPAASVVPPGR
ncbi:MULTISPECIES: hypothetical protein [unclassified Streptomyces]|uniref:hypothetical protein n=1 Tax=unclassified Streptomyces TaxID=2593676 RepID=UPI00341CB67A